ncbi:MAG: AhpC/TSA family protein [Saprospiraceae bacterium]|jgi:thiol-disulfide isomerase/thioredoxin|nr:AhpC/TSA family protein [Saprospiraceae bacterium]
MKSTTLKLASILAFGIVWLYAACGSTNAQKGVKINGEISGAQGTEIILDKINGDNSSKNVSTGKADDKGKFTLNVADSLFSEGIYLLRVGAKNAMLVFDGKEKDVTIKGDAGTLDRFQYTVEGSKAASEYVSALQLAINSQGNLAEIKKRAESAENPIVGMQIVLQGIGPNAETMSIVNTAYERVKKERPQSEYTPLYGSVIQQYTQQIAMTQAMDVIQVGQPAPDIKLSSPDGKSYSLSSLKGKVVLLDFWASWCGPCRKANPHVVETYHRYKDKGFTVFSVSLDGLDEGTRSRLAGDATQLEAQLENQKKRWVDAIAKDQLAWEYHVSDLKKWDCAPAKDYGVRGIPRTFLIDKEGKIAAINPRALESELQKLL